MKSLLTILIVLIIALPFCVNAQEEPPGGEIEDAQIIIEKDKELILPKAERIYKRTQVKSISAEVQEISYQITQPSYNFQQYVPSFSMQSLAANNESSDQAGQNFIRLGYGNYNSPLVQGYFGVRNDQSRLGLWLNHESFGKGPVRDEQSAYGYTEALVSGGITTELLSFNPSIRYQREGYYAYGYDVENIPPNYNFQTFKIGTSEFSVRLPVSYLPNEKVEISFQPTWVKTNMKFQDQDPFNSETQIGVDGGVGVELTETIDILVDASFLQMNYSGIFDQNRSLFSVSPAIGFHSDVFSASIGVKYVGASGDSTSGSNVFVDAKASYQLTSDFEVFARVYGDVEPMTLQSIRMQNRYLEDSLVFLNEVSPFIFKGGVSFGLSDRLMVSPFISYELTENKALFVHSEQDTSLFTIAYDQGTFQTFRFGLDSRYIMSPSTTLMAGFQINAYNPSDALAEAWYLPTFELKVDALQEFGDAFLLAMKLNVLAGITAPEPITETPVSMKPIIDLGLRGTYKFLDNFSAFLEFENLFSQNYERYLNYPTRGIMVKGGLTYRF